MHLELGQAWRLSGGHTEIQIPMQPSAGGLRLYTSKELQALPMLLVLRPHSEKQGFRLAISVPLFPAWLSYDFCGFMAPSLGSLSPLKKKIIYICSILRIHWYEDKHIDIRYLTTFSYLRVHGPAGPSFWVCAEIPRVSISSSVKSGVTGPAPSFCAFS